jgi:GTP-binding protein EngB required for normal cell division
MFNYIQELKLPVLIVLSKTDRLSKSEVLKAKFYIEKELFGQKVLPVSAHKKI